MTISRDWQPGTTQEMLRARAQLNADIRAFFAVRGVLEVETPLLAATTATDLHLHSLTVSGPDSPAVSGNQQYLQTSPEFAMKRLLAAGSGPIYQLGKAFRAGDLGGRHNPEFTLLEWYRPGFTLTQLMDEVEALLLTVLGVARAFDRCRRTTYRALFERYFGVNPHTADVAMLRQLAARATTVSAVDSLNVSACLDLLFAMVIEPSLGVDCPVLVFDFPLVQAALARTHTTAEGDQVASRCEVYVNGMELANAYDELTDADEQRLRFVRDNAQRRAQKLPEIPVDEALLAALEQGLPACSGIAVGVDRLLMLRTGAQSIDAVLTFGASRIQVYG